MSTHTDNNGQSKMKSVRLNATLREDIEDNVMASWKLSNKAPDVKGAEALAASALYRIKYEGFDFEALPDIVKTMLPKDTDVCVNYMGMRLYPDFGKDEEGKYIRRIEVNSKECVVKKKVPAVEKWLAARRESEAYDGKRHDYRSKIEQLLKSVNTTKQLIEIWPEVEKFIPAWIHSPSSIQLPAISIEDLNKELEQ